MGRNREYATATERKRAQRARDRASAVHRLNAPTPAVVAVSDHKDPVGALAEWSRTALIVPPGHPRSGEPLELMPFAVDWLRSTWNTHESALSTARKNAKSAICAVLALGYLCGPLRRPGWRGAIASVSKEKASELRRQVKEIAEASNLDIRIRRSPYPGVIESATGSLDTLSADRAAGHSSGYDLVIVDETGLLPERARDLLAGLRSSVSARDGRIRHISIRGDSPLFREILENQATKAHVYAAADACAVDDEEAWLSANPALGIVKSTAYMQSEVERIKSVPSDEASFRALDLNLEISPTREMICSPAISNPASLKRWNVEAPRMSGSTLARRVPGPRRRRTGRVPARCVRGSRLAIRRHSETDRKGTAPTMPGCYAVASYGPIRAARFLYGRSSRTFASTWLTPRSGGRWPMPTDPPS